MYMKKLTPNQRKLGELQVECQLIILETFTQYTSASLLTYSHEYYSTIVTNLSVNSKKQ